MSRWIDHIHGIVAAVGVQVLCPRVPGVAGAGVLREEPACVRVVEARVHILQSACRIADRAGEGHFVQEVLRSASRQIAEFIIGVSGCQGSVRPDDRRCAY